MTQKSFGNRIQSAGRVPARVAVWSGRHIEPIIGAAAFAAMLIALYLAIVDSPTERIQGIHHKIFYIHVPSALVAYLSIGLVAVGSIMYIWKRTPNWDRLAHASAEIGVILTTLTLVTGSLWGRPVWGAWWSWSDARLVTTLVMWLVYVAYLMVRSLGERTSGTARAAAVIGILGFVNVPITYFSVYLWTFLHPLPTLQSSTDRPESAILLPFLVGMTAFSLLFIYLVAMRMRLEKARYDLDALRAERETG